MGKMKIKKLLGVRDVSSTGRKTFRSYALAPGKPENRGVGGAKRPPHPYFRNFFHRTA